MLLVLRIAVTLVFMSMSSNLFARYVPCDELVVETQPLTEESRNGRLRTEIQSAVDNDLLRSLNAEETQRLEELRELLGETTDFQKAAVILAHRVGAGEKGRDGTPAARGNYTEGQIWRKARYLVAGDFHSAQWRNILRAGIAGRNRARPGAPAQDRSGLGVLGAIGGFIVGGPFGAIAGYGLGKSAEAGTLDTRAVVTGAIIGAAIDSTEVTFTDGTSIGSADDSVLDGALLGAAAGQLIHEVGQSRSATTSVAPAGALDPAPRATALAPRSTQPEPAVPSPSNNSGDSNLRNVAIAVGAAVAVVVAAMVYVESRSGSPPSSSHGYAPSLSAPAASPTSRSDSFGHPTSPYLDGSARRYRMMVP